MKKCKFLTGFLTLLLCCTFLLTPVMAKTSSSAKGYENVTQTWTETAGDPLSGKSVFYTRDLLYDKATNKQFITVQGRDGNIFYIVIDYDAQIDDDEEKYMVYFLNQVDEADLSALIDAENKPPALCSCAKKCAAGVVNTSCEICSVNMSECVGKEPEPEPMPEPDTPEPKKAEKPSAIGPVVILLAMILAGGGVACYLKFFRKKPDVSGNADLDDYDYGDEEELEDEDWEDTSQRDSEK